MDLGVLGGGGGGVERVERYLKEGGRRERGMEECFVKDDE